MKSSVKFLGRARNTAARSTTSFTSLFWKRIRRECGVFPTSKESYKRYLCLQLLRCNEQTLQKSWIRTRYTNSTNMDMHTFSLAPRLLAGLAHQLEGLLLASGVTFLCFADVVETKFLHDVAHQSRHHSVIRHQRHKVV